MQYKWRKQYARKSRKMKIYVFKKGHFLNCPFGINLMTMTFKMSFSTLIKGNVKELTLSIDENQMILRYTFFRSGFEFFHNFVCALICVNLVIIFFISY